jgi:hypothetical protein
MIRGSGGREHRATVYPRVSSRRPVGRAGIALFASGLFLVIAVFTVAVAAYVWPTGAHPTTEQTLVGHVDDFAPGSVTHLRSFGIGGHLVRLEGGAFLAFDRREPVNGCSAPWRPREQAFRDPCRSYSYDIEGRPSPNTAVTASMTRFEARVDADGEICVVAWEVTR